MTLLANIFSFSTIFSRMFSRTHKLRYLKAISKKEKTSKPLRFQGFLWSCWADSNCRPHPYQLLKSPESTAFQCFRGLFVPEMRGLWSFPLHCFHPLVFPCGSRCGSNRFQDTNEGRTSDSGRPSRCALSRS